MRKIEIAWKREWFPKIPKYPGSFWNSKENQIAFLDDIAIDYKIKEPSDWSRVTLSLVRKKGGQVSKSHVHSH